MTTSTAPSQNCQYAGLIPARASCATRNTVGAEQCAVEAPGAAERQDDEQLGRALEAERVDADEARGLRQQTRLPRRPSRPTSANTVRKRRCTSAPIAGMRRAFSRIPRSDRPNGE